METTTETVQRKTPATSEEYKIAMRAYMKAYRAANKDKFKVYQSKYISNPDNAEKIINNSKYQKKYYINYKNKKKQLVEINTNN
tara:strand:+ start:582 stop:833 length:252 start_codon:yes stop_codon:yes gene_type:complete